MPAQTRMPLKFGSETLTQIECLRVRLEVEDALGRRAEGWGETPLSVQWAWPSQFSYQTRLRAMIGFCEQLISSWLEYSESGHPMELGYRYLCNVLPDELVCFNQKASNNKGTENHPLPWLAALVCASAVDIALHDAFGVLHGVDVYATYNSQFMNQDLADLFDAGEPMSAQCENRRFRGLYPIDFLVADPPSRLVAWHLVGGLDPLSDAELGPDSPVDGYPVLLRDWIATDGLKCLKIKLRGIELSWDYRRIVDVGTIATETGVDSLSADFNCLVQSPDYVLEILDRLETEYPAIYERLLYVEQPFGYDLAKDRVDVKAIACRKPIFLDESAHDWKHVRLGRELNWNGVALKTCKTQTGALLSLAWAKANNLAVMVQDLTNPRLAQIPHVRLAAHAGTIRGVETNAMQFYPDISAVESSVHPGLYRRRNGEVDLSTIAGPGFGYRVDEMNHLATPA